jgi:hypothetical protein
MKRKLQIVIDSGDKTCASQRGKFCPMLRVTHFGTRFVCGLFGNEELKDDKGVPSGDGWLQRSSECLDLEINEDRS